MLQYNSAFPQFHLDSIRVRELSIDDADDYNSLMHDPKVQQFIGDEEIPHTLQEAKKELSFWRNLFYRRESIFWAIANSDNELIGTIGFNTVNMRNKRAEISYDLLSRYWGKGIMSAAIPPILQFAFETLGLNRIEAKTMINNEISQHLLKKFHFHKEGKLRDYRIFRGGWIDMLLFALIKLDYLKHYEKQIG